jgi:peroxiredoxin
MKAVRNYWVLLLLSLLIVGSRQVLADELRGFKELPPRTVDIRPFSDQDIDDLISTLDSLLDRDTSDRSGEDAANDLWTFRERLQTGQLESSQEARVLEHLDILARLYPSESHTLEKERRLIGQLTVGKPAPDIVGNDLNGKALRLSDYHGRVVVLAFSGEWCGSCRLEYPYQRLMLDVYKNQPLTILSVDSDRDPHVALDAKASRGLTYRSWWDGSGPKSTEGPIATAWGIMGWPTTYVIDREGVIRFVNLRQEDLLKAVKQLIAEPAATAAPQAQPE